MHERPDPFESFIFTHIPKCGGTSFRAFIFEAGIRSGIDNEKIYVPGQNNLGNDKNISQLSQDELKALQQKELKILADHSYYSVHQKYTLRLAAPFYYTILREPVSRFISHYDFFYFKLGYDDYKGIPLDELEEDRLDHVIMMLCNIQTLYLTAPSKPSGPLVDENVLHHAMDVLKNQYGCFGILEHIQESVEILQAYAPAWLHFDTVFPHKNKNADTESVMKSVSARVLDKIRYYNRFDIKLYNYALDLFSIKKRTIRLI